MMQNYLAHVVVGKRVAVSGKVNSNLCGQQANNEDKAPMRCHYCVNSGAKGGRKIGRAGGTVDLGGRVRESGVSRTAYIKRSCTRGG